jgi:hypothetical protein
MRNREYDGNEMGKWARSLREVKQFAGEFLPSQSTSTELMCAAFDV